MLKEGKPAANSKMNPAAIGRSRVFVFGFALVVTLLTLWFRLKLSPWIGENQPLLVIFFIPILFSAYLGGLWPGLVATTVAALVSDYYLISPIHCFFPIEKGSDFVRWVALVGGGVLTSILSEALHRAKKRALLSETLQSVTLASIGDAVITTDVMGRVTFLNNEAERLTGWSNQAAAGQPLPTVFHIINEKSREPIEDPVKKVFRTGAVVGLANHTLLIARDGREYVIDDSGAPIRGMNGKIIGVVLVFRDNTEKKHAEDALAESQSLYSSLVDQMPAGVFRKDADGRYVLVNSSFCRLKGVSPEDYLGKTPLELDIFDREHNAAGASHHEQIMRTGNPITVYEEHIHPDGRRLYFQAVKSPVLDGTGKVIGSQGILFDITERKQAESAFLESQALYHSLVSQMPAGIFRKDAEGRYVFVNPWFCMIKGIKEEVILGKTPREVAPYELPGKTADNDILKNQLAAQREEHHETIMRTGQTFTVEETYPGPNGTRLYLQVVKIPVFDANGKITGSLGLLFDVTERKHHEESRAQLAAIVESSSDAIISKTLDGIITSWNHGAEITFGHNAKEAIGKSMHLLIPPDRVGEEDHILERIRKGETVRHFETVRLRKDGAPIHVSVTISPLKDGSGKVVGASNVARDITELKQANEKIAHEQARFKLIIDSMPVGIAFNTVYPNGQSTRIVNEAHVRIAGVPREKSNEPGIYLQITHPEDQRIQKIFNERVKAGEIKQFNMEKRYLHAGGKVVWVNFSYQREISPDGTIEELTALTDITERKRLEEQLRQSQKMEAIGQLSGGIAHDFNNILTAILGNTSLLSDPEILPGESKECLEEIIHAARRAADLTRQLLMFSRKQAMQPVTLDLNQIVSRSIKMLQRILGEDIALHSEHAPGLPLISADTGMIEQAILNFAVNARDAMPNGGVLKICTSVENVKNPESTARDEARPHVCLSVTDSGSGIAPEILPHIFEPFFTTKEVGKGTGLGLATVYGIVQQHKGWITVNSTPGKGTAFQIYFPAITGQTLSSNATASINHLPRGSGTILVVEDELSVRNFVCQLLRRLGYTVIPAENGAEAVELWCQQQKNISLLLTDIIMPGGMSGYDLANRLTAEAPQLKIIFTSGYTGNPTPASIPLDEGKNFIRKPFDPGALAEIIRKKMAVSPDADMKPDRKP